MGCCRGMDVIPENVFATSSKPAAWSADVGEAKARRDSSRPFCHRGNIEAVEPDASQELARSVSLRSTALSSEPARFFYCLAPLRANLWCYTHIGNIGHEKVSPAVGHQVGQDLLEGCRGGI